MEEDFKKDRINQYGKDGYIGSYHFIDMNAAYPFGQLREIPSQSSEVLVRKKLHFSSKGEEDILSRTAGLLQRINHPFLINLHHMEKEQRSIYFYYQYAHLTIEKWILDLGDEIMETLKNQMLALSAFLNHHRIFFTFAPQMLGLSSQIEVQYFLHEFSLIEEKDELARLKNFRLNQEKIEHFFDSFRPDNRKQKMGGVFSSQMITESDSCANKESITTRESWSPCSPTASRIFAPRRTSRSKISEKIEKSKYKTNEILEKLRNIKNLQF